MVSLKRSPSAGPSIGMAHLIPFDPTWAGWSSTIAHMLYHTDNPAGSSDRLDVEKIGSSLFAQQDVCGRDTLQEGAYS